MYSICLVIPYFGKLPNYFNLFLQSCAANPTINWMIFTDNEENYDYPDNVKRISMTFSQMQTRIQEKFDFPIVLHKPYKLCDYKVAYGYVFEEELQGYDFWGYCDVDMLFGDLRGFLTQDILNAYDKLGHLGHLTLFRNTKENNRLFMSAIDGRKRYKEVFSTPYICIFDEWQYPSINHIFFDNHRRVFLWDFIADIYPYDSYYRRVSWDVERQTSVFGKENCVVKWEDGHAFLMWKKGGRWKEEEYLYIHLQKRKMKPNGLKSAKFFYAIPERFADATEDLNHLYLICRCKQVINIARMKRALEGIKYWLIEKTGPARHWFRDKWRKHYG